MKVLFINTYDDPSVSRGGAEVTIRNLRYGLQRLGIDTVMACVGGSPGMRRVDQDGLRSWHVGLRNVYKPEHVNARPSWQRMIWHALDKANPFMQGYLRRILEIERPDVVSAHNLAGWSALIWKTVHRAGIPIIQVLHDHYLICPKTTMFKGGGNCSQPCGQCRILRAGHVGASLAVTAVVGVSNYVLARHLQLGYFAGTSQRYAIHNARSQEALGVLSDCPPAVPRERLRIGFIGRLDPSKGIQELLVAFAGMSAVGTELWIAGGGDREFEKSLRATWSSPRIRFLGRVNPTEFYPEVDIVVVPSLWQEPLGMVVAEAFAFGRPVVAARRGGISEMVEDGVNGLLFDPARQGDLTACLDKLCDKPSLRTALSSNARKSAAPFVDVRAWAARYEQVYRTALSSEGAQRA